MPPRALRRRLALRLTRGLTLGVLGIAACLDPGHPTDAWSLAELRAAAEAGDPEAQFALGRRHSVGYLAERDPAAAVQWYARAAEAGHPGAQRALAVRYREGLGVPRDLDESARLLRAAADTGDRKAQELLGVAYFRGDGVPVDYVESYRWLELASRAGSGTAREFLPTVGQRLTPQQRREAVRRAEDWLESRNP